MTVTGPEQIRLERVVTGVDFYESSRSAALWAMQQLAPDAKHVLVNAVELPELPGPLRGLAPTHEQLRLATIQEARDRLEELKGLGGSAAVDLEVREGRPAHEIVRVAEETGADLIVTGEQGPARGVAALLGSTAERVLIVSPVPVLIARKAGGTAPRRLLVAIDPSQVAGRVLSWARELMTRFGAEATVVTVVDRVLLSTELTGKPTAEQLRALEDEARAGMREWLESEVRSAELPEGDVESKVLVGDPAYEIVAEAARLGADLVLVGSKGADISRTPLLGRILNKVVRSAPCSVLVVQPGRKR